MNRAMGIALAALLVAAGAVGAAELRITKIAPDGNLIQSQVTLSDGTTVLVPLVRVKPIAVLRAPSGKPQLLLSGATCTECDMNQSIYLVQFDFKGRDLPRYSYPGTLKTYDTQELVQKARMFYGQCFSTADVVVWFLEYLGDDQKWHTSNSALRAKDEGAIFSKLSPLEGSLDAVVQRTKAGLCKELPGTHGHTEP